MRHRPLRLPGPAQRRHHRDLRGARDPTHVGSLRVDLHIPQSRSLKAKRAAIKPVIEGARRRFSVAVAETDHHDLWQRAEIGVAVVAATEGHAEEVLDAVERWIWAQPDIEVLTSERLWADT